MHEPPFPTVAVFSTYGPSVDAVGAIASALAQVDAAVVVDDGSGPSADAVLAQLEAVGATVLRSERNSGIAAALNRGIRWAGDHGASAVITFDQDSTVPDGFVDALRAAETTARDRGIDVGVVVPEFFAGVRQARGPAIGGISDAADVIQSGMLIPLATIERAGDLREDFFIDRVDTEFELRLRRAGLSVVAAEGLRLGHALGAAYRRELFGRPVRVPGIPPVLTLSTPFRYFYRVRNRLVLNGEHFAQQPLRIARDTLFDLIHFADVLRVARPRRSMWRLYRAAMSAAIRGRMGRMPEALAPFAAEITWSAPRVERDEGVERDEHRA